MREFRKAEQKGFLEYLKKGTQEIPLYTDMRNLMLFLKDRDILKMNNMSLIQLWRMYDIWNLLKNGKITD